MAPRKKNASIKSSGATSSKAAPLPDWVKNGGKPPPPSTAPKTGSGSGGGSAPCSSSSSSSSQGVGGRPPPLFPPGTKTPVNLLNERIQKLFKDWNRPEYHPRPARAQNNTTANDAAEDGNGDDDDGSTAQSQSPSQMWTCSVTLTRPNPKDKSTSEVVKLIPDDRDQRQRITVDSKELARHWAATYALFRLFSHLSLALMLPAQFRDYWAALELWKKSLPAHLQASLFAADPFTAQEKARAAKREREQQAQAASAQARDGGQLNKSQEERLPKRWKDAKEVRMSKPMRDWVEEVVKAASLELPDDEGDDDLVEDDGSDGTSSSTQKQSSQPQPQIDSRRLGAQFTTLGFRSGYIAAALSWLPRARVAIASRARSNDPLLSTIKHQADDEALLTYLTLYVPEEDLPARFKASKTSTNEGFVTATQSGKTKEDGLKMQWAVDRIVKAAGYPRSAVEKAMTQGDEEDVGRRELQVLRKLSGFLHPPSAASTELIAFPVPQDVLERRQEELTVLQSILGEDRVATVPPEERPLDCLASPEECFEIIVAGPSRAAVDGGDWGTEEIRLRVLWRADCDTTQPTFYVSSPGSPQLPSYMRLALTQHLLRRLQAEQWQQDGQVLLPMVECLEESWGKIVKGGSVRLEDVMGGFTASSRRSGEESSSGTSTPRQTSRRKGNFAPARALARDAAADNALQEAQRRFRESATGEKLLAQRATLPIYHHCQDIVSVLASHRLTLLTGSTGSGKTTQLPQFILDAMIQSGSGSECKIIVTQPRRVSAMSIAERVAFERGEAIGQTVGWAVRGERKVGRGNRILFTTTGLLLRRLQSEPDLASISHLLIDEIHERSLDSDLLLLEIASLLKSNPKIKVVLMSATLQKDKFVRYFSGRIPPKSGGVGSVDVEGRIHPVQDFYLEDLIKDTGYRPSGQSLSRDRGAGALKGLRADLSAQGFSEGEITALEVLERERPGQAVGPLDYELVGRAVLHVASREAAKEKASGDGRVGAILVFMSGVGEIRQAMEAIRAAMQQGRSAPGGGGGDFEVIPLHSNLSNDEQQRVFKPARAGARKIVVSTNVAEASVTIDGITAVIDSGRVKETSYDPESGLTRLVEQYTSKASATQRRGRAGRTRAGECWKLFSRTLEAKKMPDDGQPEMTRVPLESVILHVLCMNKSDVTSYLSSALDPPSLTSISTAISNLFEAGAVRQLQQQQHLATTALGRHLANLPLDLRLGKLLILGCTFQCLGPLLTIAALMSCKPLFAAPFEQRDELSDVRRRKAVGQSDLLTDAAIYDEWSSIRRRPSGAGSANAEMKRFAAEHFLNPSALRDVTATRLDLLSNLQEIGFAPRDYNMHASAGLGGLTGGGSSSSSNAAEVTGAHTLDKQARNVPLLQSLLTASLYPNLLRIAHPETKYNQSSSGTVAREIEAKQLRLFDDASFEPRSSSAAPGPAAGASASSSSTSTAAGPGPGPATATATAPSRVFLHPSSVLFSETKLTNYSHLVSFRKSAAGGAGAQNAKTYLRDATPCPVYALLLFCGGAAGGAVKVHHMMGGVSIGVRAAAAGAGEGLIRLRAPARIAVLSAQLRRLLDVYLERCFGDGEEGAAGEGEGSGEGGRGRQGSAESESSRRMDEVVRVMRALLEGDGMGVNGSAVAVGA